MNINIEELIANSYTHSVSNSRNKNDITTKRIPLSSKIKKPVIERDLSYTILDGNYYFKVSTEWYKNNLNEIGYGICPLFDSKTNTAYFYRCAEAVPNAFNLAPLFLENKANEGKKPKFKSDALEDNIKQLNCIETNFYLNKTDIIDLWIISTLKNIESKVIGKGSDYDIDKEEQEVIQNKIEDKLEDEVIVNSFEEELNLSIDIDNEEVEANFFTI